jgi:hypothetical protein
MTVLTTTMALLTLGATLSLLAAQKPPTAGTQDAQLTHDFEVRVKHYIDFRDKQAGNAPKAGNDPQAIVSRQRQLANKIRVARAGAKQAEIFTPPIAHYFRHQIAATKFLPAYAIPSRSR